MARINIVVTHDKNMRALKKHWFGMDEVTDVISFPNKSNDMKDITPDKEISLADDLVGEIVINEDEVKRNAKSYGVTFEQEMARVVAHGVLHLYGYTDDTSEGKAAMKAIEDKIVSNGKWKA